MKATLRTIAVSVTAAGLAFSGAMVASADDTLDADEKASVAFSREEERLARDLYTEFGKLYDSVVWDRIAGSEQRHFDAIGRLLTTYELDDPSAGLAAGTYSDDTLQDLYDDWLADGKANEDAAFKAAIELEKRDIADLKAQLKIVDDDAVENVYERLLKGSENHLAAFTRWSEGDQTMGQPGNRPNGNGPNRGNQQGQPGKGQPGQMGQREPGQMGPRADAPRAAQREDRPETCDGTGPQQDRQGGGPRGQGGRR